MPIFGLPPRRLTRFRDSEGPKKEGPGVGPSLLDSYLSTITR